MIPTPLLRCDRRPAAPDVEISAAERSLALTFPPDYKALLRETNGLEGFVTQAAYLILWPVSDVPSLNEAYDVSEFLMGVTLIGTNGGNTGYGFSFENGQPRYVSTPLVGMEPTQLRFMGTSLEELAAQIGDG